MCNDCERKYECGYCNAQLCHNDTGRGCVLVTSFLLACGKEGCVKVCHDCSLKFGLLKEAKA